MGFTRNEQMGCSEAFRGNANGSKHPRNFTSHVGTPQNVSSENMTRPGELQKYPKKESCGFERIYGCLYVDFEAILDFEEK